MISFNHYALGAVADWLHRVVGGLAPASPGWRELCIAPVPGGGLRQASSRLDTPYGLASSSWELGDGTVAVEAVVPPNSTAHIRLPGASRGARGRLRHAQLDSAVRPDCTPRSGPVVGRRGTRPRRGPRPAVVNDAIHPGSLGSTPMARRRSPGVAWRLSSGLSPVNESDAARADATRRAIASTASWCAVSNPRTSSCTTTRARPCTAAAISAGGNAVASMPYSGRIDPKRGDLHLADVVGELGHFGLQRGAVVRSCGQLDEQRGAARIRDDLPPGAQRFGRRERRLQAFDIAFGTPPEHLDEQVVERPEVVVRASGRLRPRPVGRSRPRTRHAA